MFSSERHRGRGFERLRYDGEGHRKVAGSNPAWAIGDWKSLVNPAVNGYLFRIKEG